MIEDVLLRESVRVAASGTRIAIGQLTQVTRNLTLAMLYYQQGREEDALKEIGEIDARLKEATDYADRSLEMINKITGHASDH